jgi:hypothetical protein
VLPLSTGAKTLTDASSSHGLELLPFFGGNFCSENFCTIMMRALALWARTSSKSLAVLRSLLPPH